MARKKPLHSQKKDNVRREHRGQCFSVLRIIININPRLSLVIETRQVRSYLPNPRSQGKCPKAKQKQSKAPASCFVFLHGIY